MIDISTVHPFEACAGFAVRLLNRLAAGDMAGAEALIDGDDTGQPFAESFPAPDGFTYARPDQMPSWSMHLFGVDQPVLRLDFEFGFADPEYRDRTMFARFVLRRVGDALEVRLAGVVPS